MPGADNEQMEHTGKAFRWQDEVPHPHQPGKVGLRHGPPFFVPLVQMPQLDAKHRGLQFVQARIDALDGIGKPCGRAVIPQAAGLFGQFPAVRGDGPAIAQGAQVFGGVKAGGIARPKRPGLFALPSGAMALRIVFNNREVVISRYFPQLRHVAGRPVEVHGHDGLGVPGNGGLHQGGVHQHGAGAYVHGNGFGPRAGHRQPTGNVGMRWHDDFVPRANAQKVQ